MCFKTTRVLAEALKSISRGTSFENVLDKVKYFLEHVDTLTFFIALYRKSDYTLAY